MVWFLCISLGGEIMKLEYKFSYGNILNFVFSEIILIIYNFFSFLIIAIPIFLVYSELEYTYRENYILMKIITIFMTILLGLYALYLVIIFFLPKKAIINDNFIIVKRYMLNFRYVFRGFNDEIYINDIIECKKYDGKRFKFDRTAPYAVFFFDWDNLVELKMKDDKIYLIPLKNSFSFIEKVNELRQR